MQVVDQMPHLRSLQRKGSSNPWLYSVHTVMFVFQELGKGVVTQAQKSTGKCPFGSPSNMMSPEGDSYIFTDV